MDAIEKAIRNAFDKGDPRERAFREKVYRSAFAALDRALEANPDTAPEIAKRRRQALSAKISEIESEFIPAVQQVEPAIRHEPRPGAPSRSYTRVEPDFEAHTDPARAPSPELDTGFDRSTTAFEPRVEHDDRPGDPARPGDSYADDYVEPPVGQKPRRRGRPWAAAFIGVTLLSAVGIGIWWSYDSGFFKTPAQRDQSVPNPPQELEEEDFTPPGDEAGPPRIPGGADSLEDWIVVFEPSDPTTVTAPGDSSAEAMEADGEEFLRIRSGASGSPILFDVGQGILEQVAGRRTVFNIVARAEEGQETQISVDCNLGELGDCGRKRYAAGVTREEFLFEVALPDADPGAGGTIAINPDIDGSGKALDIYEIRVSPAE